MDIYEELSRIAWKYGLVHQEIKLIEELAELTVELAKSLNNDGDEAKIIEELADAEIMINQIIVLRNCRDSVSEVEKFKIERQLERMQNGSDKV